MKVPYLLPYLLSLGYAWITAAECAFKRTLPMTATKPTQGIAVGYPGRDKSRGLIHPTSQSRSLQPFWQGLAVQQCSGANQHQTEVSWEALNKSLPLPLASPCLQKMHLPSPTQLLFFFSFSCHSFSPAESWYLCLYLVTQLRVSC